MKGLGRGSYLALVYAFLYLPIAVLIVYSFNDARYSLSWQGFTWGWYESLSQNDDLIDVALNSVIVALLSATAATVIGTLGAVALYRYRFTGRSVLNGLIFVLIMSPEIVMGISLLLLFVAMAQLVGWPAERGMVTIWIAHTTFCTAYVAIVVSARLRELDLSIEEAAMDLGAKPWKVFFLITIPMIAPSLAAGGMMSFALSLDDLVLASFVSGPGSTTLPMEVFSAVRLGVKPEINAVASLILLSVSLFTFGSWYLMAKAEKRRRAEIAMTTQMQAVA